MVGQLLLPQLGARNRCGEQLLGHRLPIRAAGVPVQEAGQPGPAEAAAGVRVGVSGGEEAQHGLAGQVGAEPGVPRRSEDLQQRVEAGQAGAATLDQGSAAWSPGAAGRRAPAPIRGAAPRDAAAAAGRAAPSRAGRSWRAWRSKPAGRPPVATRSPSASSAGPGSAPRPGSPKRTGPAPASTCASSRRSDSPTTTTRPPSSSGPGRTPAPAGPTAAGPPWPSQPQYAPASTPRRRRSGSG